MGITCIEELGPQSIRRAEAVTPPHEMSAWVNMPKTAANHEGRIL